MSITTFRSTTPRDDILWARPNSLDAVRSPHASMTHRERLYIYATVFALAPRRCLEVGVYAGGSTLMIHAALADLGSGTLISIDPSPAVRFDWAAVSPRARLITGRSPADLPRAVEASGGKFDFILLDADHSAAAVRADLLGLMDAAAPGAVILCHDAYHAPLAGAIDGLLKEGLPCIDAGIVCTTPNRGTENNQLAAYGGFRLLRRT